MVFFLSLAALLAAGIKVPLPRDVCWFESRADPPLWTRSEMFLVRGRTPVGCDLVPLGSYTILGSILNSAGTMVLWFSSSLVGWQRSLGGGTILGVRQ